MLNLSTGFASSPWIFIAIPYAVAFGIITVTDLTILSIARQLRRFIPIISGLVGFVIGLIYVLNVRMMMSQHIYGAVAGGGRSFFLFGFPLSMIDLILEIYTNLHRDVLLIVDSMVFILDWFFWGAIIGLLLKVVNSTFVRNRLKNGSDN